MNSPRRGETARHRIAGSGLPAWLPFVSLVLLTAGCASAPDATERALRELREWSIGPVRWIMLPAERRNLADVTSPAEAVNFIESFWALRDPDPSTPDNSFRETFGSRVEAADLLYPEAGLRGSLTARGRALVLLGPAARLKVSSEPALSWTTGRRANRRVTTRNVDVEIWHYPPETLPSRYEAALRALGFEDGAELRFHLTASGSRLVEGENYLEMAARVALVRD